MKLTRVTISGADDDVPHEALRELSAEFPWVEWGILMSNKRFGTPRYPSTKWLHDAQDLVFYEAQVSFHLCGMFSRRVMSGDPTMVPRGVKRMQLNGFSDFVLPGLLCAEGAPEVQFILQCSHARARLEARRLHQAHSNVAILDDASGGTGIAPDEFATHFDQTPMGHAGGITEDNIQSTIERVLTLGCYEAPIQDTWIDLESGARTDGAFDIQKVRRILELAKPFVSGAA